jgi:hypothetical protein
LPYWLCPLFLKHGLPQELILLSCPEPAIFFYFRIRDKVTGMNKIDPSSKGGINSEPRRVTSTLLSVKQCSLPIKCFFSILNKKLELAYTNFPFFY